MIFVLVAILQPCRQCVLPTLSLLHLFKYSTDFSVCEQRVQIRWNSTLEEIYHQVLTAAICLQCHYVWTSTTENVFRHLRKLLSVSLHALRVGESCFRWHKPKYASISVFKILKVILGSNVTSAYMSQNMPCISNPACSKNDSLLDSDNRKPVPCTSNYARFLSLHIFHTKFLVICLQFNTYFFIEAGLPS